MDLSELSKFIEQQRAAFIKTVEEKAKELKLEDVSREIDNNLLMFPSLDDDAGFIDGREIILKLNEGYFTVRINLDYISIETPNGYVLQDFGGETVETIYRVLSERIVDERDLPF